MASKRTRPQTASNKKFKKEDLVVATIDFVGRSTPPAPLTGTIHGPISHEIKKGTPGIVHGSAEGIPGRFDVSFEAPDGAYMRVEVEPHQISYD